MPAVGSTAFPKARKRYIQFWDENHRKDGRCTNVVLGIKCAIRYVKDRYGKDPAAAFGPLALKSVRERMVDEGLRRRYIIQGYFAGQEASAAVDRCRAG